jgi:HEAT repeat protein
MNDQSIPALVDKLSDDDGLVRKRARHTLVLIGSPALPSLLELVESPVKRTRWEAAKALAEIGHPSSVSALVELLQDPESDIRWLGAEGLIRIGSRSLRDVLRLLIERPDSTDVRRAAHHVFRELGSQNSVVEELLAPVMEVLGDTDPAGAIPPRAEETLEQLESYQREDFLEW